MGCIVGVRLTLLLSLEHTDAGMLCRMVNYIKKETVKGARELQMSEHEHPSTQDSVKMTPV